jgi:hypothetical protein
MTTTRTNPPTTGETLPNGATVIVALPHPYDPSVCYVGAETGGVHPFASWQYNPSTQEAYWGHYYKTAKDMLSGLQQRASVEG